LSRQKPDHASSLSAAIAEWYRFYGVVPDASASNVLCDAAMALSAEGYAGEEIAAILISVYVGILSTRVNAPTSQSLH
jgi:hypothetical protein